LVRLVEHLILAVFSNN
jgi:hypothetical protein